VRWLYATCYDMTLETAYYTCPCKCLLWDLFDKFTFFHKLQKYIHSQTNALIHTHRNLLLRWLLTLFCLLGFENGAMDVFFAWCAVVYSIAAETLWFQRVLEDVIVQLEEDERNIMTAVVHNVRHRCTNDYCWRLLCAAKVMKSTQFWIRRCWIMQKNYLVISD